MIIVNQEKNAIINFDNVEILGIGNPLENNNGKFAIIANIISDNQYILAEYETKERAEKVLSEIASLYEKFQIVVGERGGITDYIETPKKYVMPKE